MKLLPVKEGQAVSHVRLDHVSLIRPDTHNASVCNVCLISGLMIRVEMSAEDMARAVAHGGLKGPVPLSPPPPAPRPR